MTVMNPLFSNELRFVGTTPTPIGIATGTDPVGQYTVAGGSNLSHTLWTVTCNCPDDVSAGVQYASMQALLMNSYGYNLLGATYGSGLLSLQVDDLGGLNPSDPTSPGKMIGAVADALAAAGEINATNLTASSSNTAGFSFPVTPPPSVQLPPGSGLPAGGSITGSPSGTQSTIGGFDIYNTVIKPFIDAITKALSAFGTAAIWVIAIVAGLAIIFIAARR